MAPSRNAPSHRQLAHWVAEQVRAEILEGKVAPGEWLRQERLAAQFGVSHMPVREALRQLAAEGLVEHMPYRGARVVQFSVSDVEDLYACRVFVEGLAARYAAAAITDDEVRELADLHRRMIACKMPSELPDYRELNRRFHAGIFTASRRSYLIRTLAQLWAAFPTMLWSNIPRVARASTPARDATDNDEHEAIVRALTARDPEAAEEALRRHVEAAGRDLVSAMKGED